MSKGGFGSGFLYVDSIHGRNFIITNKHVLVQAQTVDVEFMLEDHSIRSFTNCKILASDDKYDLAIIELPAQAKFSSMLELSSDAPTDGTAVYTAGFPALNGKPSWQFGNGVVSNSSLQLDELMLGNLGVIQHTAQVDKGSSGGPLMIKSSKTDGYQIIGINTWKIKERESVNISIPSSVILKFINESLQSKNDSKEALTKQLTAFFEVKNDGYKKILPFVSYDFVSTISIFSFLDMLKMADKNVSDEARNQFNNGFPVEGVRILVAEAIYKKILNKELSLYSIEYFSLTDPVNVTVFLDGKKIVTNWVYDEGQWRMVNFAGLKLHAEWNRGISEKFCNTTIISVSNEFGGVSLVELSLQKNYADLLFTKTSVGLNRDFVGFSYGLGYHLPYQFAKRALFIPNVMVFPGIVFPKSMDNDLYGSININAKLGADLAFVLNKNLLLTVGAGCKFCCTLIGSSESGPFNESIVFNVGLAY